jgi:hypothetical protein
MENIIGLVSNRRFIMEWLRLRFIQFLQQVGICLLLVLLMVNSTVQGAPNSLDTGSRDPELNLVIAPPSASSII